MRLCSTFLRPDKPLPTPACMLFATQPEMTDHQPMVSIGVITPLAWRTITCNSRASAGLEASHCLLQVLLKSHKAWLRRQRCKDPFEGLLDLDVLRKAADVDPPFSRPPGVIHWHSGCTEASMHTEHIAPVQSCIMIPQCMVCVCEISSRLHRQCCVITEKGILTCGDPATLLDQQCAAWAWQCGTP